MPSAANFDGLPDAFKEDLTIYHRVISGEDDRGQPTYSETSEIVRGFFQVQKMEDMVIEAGVKVSRTANVYLGLSVVVGLIDQVEAASVSGVRWAVVSTPYKSHLQQEVLVQEVVP